MKTKIVNKYLGKRVAIMFSLTWWNEATQNWVWEDEEYIGVLNHCNCKGQEKYYQLDSSLKLPTDNACWDAIRIKSIKEVLL